MTVALFAVPPLSRPTTSPSSIPTRPPAIADRQCISLPSATPLHAKHPLTYLRGLPELVGAARGDDAPLDKEIPSGARVQRPFHILLYDEHTDSGVGHCGESVEDLVHDDRRQPE